MQLGCFQIRNNYNGEADMSTSAKIPAKAKATKTSPPAKPSGATSASKVPAPAPVSALDGKAPPAAKATASAVVEKPQAVILGPVMRKKELIDTVVVRSGIKKKDAKPVIDAMLAVLGEALADNRELILPPMGRVKVRKEKKLPNGRVLVTKIRQTTQLKKPDAI
jgi:DNA-binding protein HU-alpha